MNMNAFEQTPLVTMVIPSYNHGRYVQACIRSVIAQDYANIELVIIDDGSTDDSIFKISEMAQECHARFRRFEFMPRANKGLSATLNEAMEWAQGDYFSVTDSDDVLLPSKTSILLSHIEGRPEIASVFAGCEVIDADGAVQKAIRPRPTLYTFSDILNRNKMLFSSSMLARLDSMRRTGGYLKALYIEDWYMWLKLTEHGAQLKVLAEPVFQYRQHQTNMSKNVLKMFEARREILTIFRHHPGVSMSISKILLELSVELSRISKRASFKYVVEAAGNCPWVVFRLYFWNAIARMLTPAPMLNMLARMKRRIVCGGLMGVFR